jgi:hypothetical protein
MNADVEMANDNEGADPTDDIKKQNPGQSVGSAGNANSADNGSDVENIGDIDNANDVAEDDPKKVQKLAKAGEAEVDPNEGSD